MSRRTLATRQRIPAGCGIDRSALVDHVSLGEPVNLQSEAQSSENPGEARESDLRGTAVFEGFDGGAADTGPLGKIELPQHGAFPCRRDLLPNARQIGHAWYSRHGGRKVQSLC